MKLNKNKIYILGLVDNDGRYDLRLNHVLRTKEELDDLLLDVDLQNTKELFLLESIKEKSIKSGYNYYFLYERFFEGFKDDERGSVRSKFFNKESFVERKNRFISFYNKKAIDRETGNDKKCWYHGVYRCCFKKIPITIDKKITLVVEKIEYIISSK